MVQVESIWLHAMESGGIRAAVSVYFIINSATMVVHFVRLTAHIFMMDRLYSSIMFYGGWRRYVRLLAHDRPRKTASRPSQGPT